MKSEYKLSWVCYLQQVIIYLIVLLVILSLKSWLGVFSSILALIWTIWVFVQILENLKTKFIIDDEGVWISSGLFPWNKGIYGLGWRDISDAVYKTGFFSWVLKSYTITIRHRYTKSNHLVFEKVAKGDLMVGRINEIVNQKNLY